MTKCCPIHDHRIGEGDERDRTESFDLDQQRILRRTQVEGRQCTVVELRDTTGGPAQSIAVAGPDQEHLPKTKEQA